MDGIEVLGVPVTDFDPYCLKHGEERRELFKLATLEDAGLKRSALLKYFLPKKPSEKRRFTDFAPKCLVSGRTISTQNYSKWVTLCSLSSGTSYLVALYVMLCWTVSCRAVSTS
jgi:hypothetical protein